MFLPRDICKNEFIIPLGPELKELYSDEEMRHSLRSLQTESVRPQLRMTDIVYVYIYTMLMWLFFFEIKIHNETSNQFWVKQKRCNFIIEMFLSLYLIERESKIIPLC